MPRRTQPAIIPKSACAGRPDRLAPMPALLTLKTRLRAWLLLCATALTTAALAQPAGLPPDAAEAARATLGGAVDAARALAPTTGDALLRIARAVYVDTLQTAAWICAGLSLGATALILALRRPLAATPPAVH